MPDVITTALLEAKQKDKLNRTDVMIRYLRIKYKLSLTSRVLEKRIKRITFG